MGTPRLSAAATWWIAGIVLASSLVGCRSQDDGAAAPRPSVSPSYTRVVADNGCHLHVAPIRLPPYHRPPFESGPTPERIRTAKGSPGLRGYPRFPRALDGLPVQGVDPRETVEGVFYSTGRVDGLTFDELLSRGGVVVSASRVGRHLQEKLSHPSASLTHVRIGTSPRWLYQAQDTGGGLVRRSLNWVTADRFFLSITAQRPPARLVSLARSLAC
jgi:hypothetical protein